MNIGLIGLGYWGKNLYRNLLITDKVKQIYVLDFQVKNFKKNKKVSFYQDSNLFFNNKDIDAFIISTPTSTSL